MFNQMKEYLSNLLGKEERSILSIIISVVTILLILLIIPPTQDRIDMARLLHSLFYLLQHFHH